MKKKFVKIKKYDGSQLRPLFAYEQFGLKGPSLISWISPTDVVLEHMVDYEDKIKAEKICGDLMLHFLVEYFPADLLSGVALQRLLASLIKDEISKVIKNPKDLIRSGDDLYYKKGKLSISIASVSAVSTQIHFALNVTNQGTPVKTACLNDLKILAQPFAEKVMALFAEEFNDIQWATQKVKPL